MLSVHLERGILAFVALSAILILIYCEDNMNNNQQNGMSFESLCKFILRNGLLDDNVKTMLSALEQAPSQQVLSALMCYIKPMLDSNIDGVMKLGFREDTGSPVGINYDDNHCVLFGKTRSGKSVIMTLLALQAIKESTEKVVVWYFARADDLRRLLYVCPDIIYVNFDGQIKYNPIPKDDNYGIFTDPFIQATNLFDGSDNFLASNIAKLKTVKENPDLKDLIEHLNIKARGAFNPRLEQYRTSCLNRLNGMFASKIGNILKPGKDSFDDFLTNHTVFELRELRSWENILIVNWLILQLFHVKMKYGLTNVRHVIFLDDASPLFYKEFDRRPRRPMIADIFDTVAKAGIQLFTAVQIPTDVMQCLFAETSVKILLKQESLRDTIFVAERIAIPRDQWEECFWLQPRTAIISMREKPAFKLFIPEVELPDHKLITDEMIADNNKRILGLVEQEESVGNNMPETICNGTVTHNQDVNNKSESNPQDKTDEAMQEAKKFLYAVHLKQFTASLSDLSKHLSYDNSKTSRIVKYLEDKKHIEITKIVNGRKHLKYPTLTESGYSLIDLKPDKPDSKGGGKGHTIRQYLFVEKLEKMGLNPEREKHLGENHHGDIVFFFDGKKIALEIAITSGNEKNNIENDLRLGCDHVIIGCKDKKVLDEVQEIAKGNERVTVCLLSQLYECDDISSFIKNA